MFSLIIFNLDYNKNVRYKINIKIFRKEFMFKTLVLLFSIAFSFHTLAEERSDYPELQVTPKSSERLALESEYERAKPWSFQSPITISALSTFTAALIQGGKTDLRKDPNEYSKSVGMLVGGGWLALNMYMAYQYQGYTTASNKVSALPAKTSREQLIKERLSEEEMNHLGRIGKTMKWGSFATNLLAGGYMMSKAAKDSNAQIFDGIAIVTSFLPLIFSNHFEDVALEQQQYKKKIFGAISSNFLFQDPTSSKWVPGVGFTATF